jgi:hypothetical protein
MSTTETLPATAVPDATPAEQLVLVDHLQIRMHDLFSGSAPEFEELRRRYPSKVLQLGVIPPLPEPDPDTGETPEQFAKRLRRPPSNIGLDFEVERAPDGTVTVEVEGRFAFYVQRYPDRDAQAEFYAGGQEKATREEGENAEDPDTKENVRLLPVFKRYDIDSGRIAVTLDGDTGEEVIDLAGPIVAVLGPVLVDRGTVYSFWGRRSHTLPAAALAGDQAHFEHAIEEAEGGSRSEPLAAPKASIVVTWQPSADGRIRAQATLRNDTLVKLRNQERPKKKVKKDGGEAEKTKATLARDMDLFDTRIRVFQDGGAFRRIEFRRAPKDFRYANLRHVWAVGRNCHGRRMDVERDGEDGVEEPLTTDHWPVYLQKQMTPRKGKALQLKFAELADESTCMQALGRISAAMKTYDGQWEQQLTDWPAESKAECQKALVAFRQDIESFERGVACLNRDPLLAKAFRAANHVFDVVGADRGIDKWRLFQVVYQVIHVAALRAREQGDAELLAELDTVDVLWFPTGGGKTEAYLGLIIAAMFYDRLRGKKRGVTAILRFPLRMLSVQQLQRLLIAVAAAERHRQELAAAGESLDGDPFALGYWAGGSNSPNSLVRDSKDNPFEHIKNWVTHVDQAADHGDDKRIITVCPDPACKGKVRLLPDPAAVRLRHVCTQCGNDVPVYITDDEVYRYLPAVVVSTVDKLAHVARADQFVNLLAGPAYRCPDHGYFTWHEAGDERDASGAPKVKDRCMARDLCTRTAGEYEAVEPTKDPTPALIVQDELHLLEEELGTFASHYDTLLKVMQERLAGGLASKLLAATATIEAFEEQVHHLYAREARVFPSPGWKLGESFYVETDEDVVRRVYVGALPSRPDVTEFGALAQTYLHQEVVKMQRNPDYGLHALGMGGVHDEDWLQKLLLDYELTLGYVNRKADADRIAYELNRAAARPELDEELLVKVLIGGGADMGTPLAEIADTLNEIVAQYKSQPDRTKRLRAMVATSVISHGVDLDALNLMVVNNMTPTVAQYVQASSRSGRSSVGLVLLSFDRRAARERAFFTYFREYHAFLDRMIAPVPVNRFARFAAHATVPGILSALIIQVLNRERLRDKGLNPKRPLTSLRVGTEMRRFISSAEPPADKAGLLKQLAFQSLGISAQVRRRRNGKVKTEPVFPPRLTQWLEYEANEQCDRQLAELRDPGKRGSTSGFFRPDPLTSFREVDEPTEFVVATKYADVEGDLARQK